MHVNLLQAVEDEYDEMDAIKGHELEVTFEQEEITLDIGEMEISGWKITPYTHPVVSPQK